MLTMLIGGLWHGANWTFIAWGAVHGAWLVLHRLLNGEQAPVQTNMWMRVLKCSGTFHIVCLTWLLFRSATIKQAWQMLARLGVDWRWSELPAYTFGMIALLALPLMLYEVWLERKGRLLALTDVHWAARASVYALIVLALLCLAPEQTSEFIYFQF
jgi:hypothetical protein